MACYTLSKSVQAFRLEMSHVDGSQRKTHTNEYVWHYILHALTFMQCGSFATNKNLVLVEYVYNSISNTKALPDGMKAACCWNCMLARACWYWNTPALNIVVAPLAFSSAGLFGKGGKTGGSPWWGTTSTQKDESEGNQWWQWHPGQREERILLED